jgi:membrane associated rhomboid family serine protease
VGLSGPEDDDPSGAGGLTVVFTSASHAACDERAFMLAAVNIGSKLAGDGTQFWLSVANSDVPAARAHLRAYAAERRAASARTSAATAPAPRLHRGAWLGCVVYVAVLYGIALAVSDGLWRTDSFQQGELAATLVRSGQWWRAWTALTLHRDADHLFANLGAGVWFGYLAARQVGVGLSWLLIVTGAAAANLFNAALGPSTYLSVGASTAVFTALGLMAAHAWRTRRYLPQRWALRWAPLVGGLVLLGWFGSSGEGTDLVAHATGFVIGALLGIVVAKPAVDRALNRIPQWITGLAALGSVLVAWAWALTR